MRVIGVIPARWGSTRFPGKPLAMIAGKPLIMRVWEQSRKAGSLDRLIVATDDERIRRAAESFGAEAVMTRRDHLSGTDRVEEAIRGERVEIAVNIQGDEPLMDPGLIDNLVNSMSDALHWDMATAASDLSADEAQCPDICKVVVDSGWRALYFSRFPIPYVRDSDFNGRDRLYLRHIGIYAYRATFLRRLVAEPPCLLEKAERLEQLRALYMGAFIKVKPSDSASIGVDVPSDVEAVERALSQQGVS